jgi:hypothetical protein
MVSSMPSGKGEKFGKKGLTTSYGTSVKSKEWLITNCVVNVVKGYVLGFHTFKGERIKEDYIRHCKLGTCIMMQTKL